MRLVALRDDHVIKVHLVVYDELLPERADDTPHAVGRVSTDPYLMALVLVLRGVVPVAFGGIAFEPGAGQAVGRCTGKIVVIEISGPRTDAAVVGARRTAKVVGVVLLAFDMADQKA